METSSPQSTSRRSFLKLGAAALAASAVGAPRLWAADAHAAHGDDYGGLKMGIQSYSLRDRSFEKTLEAMKNDLKLHYVEVYPAHFTGKSPRQNMDLLKSHDVTVLSYGVIPFSKDEKKNREQFELAKSYGMKNLSCDPDDNPETFDSLEKLTEEYGITVAIHPHGPGHKWGKVSQLERAFKGRSNRIGLCNDTGHLIRSGEDPVKACETFKDRLHALHLKDFKKVSEGKWEDVPAGQATLDVDGIVKFLIANHFKGGVFIEYEGGKPVESVQQSLARVKEAVKKAEA